jgi:hypothetical protein
MPEYEREHHVNDIEYREADASGQGVHREVVRKDVVHDPFLRRRLLYDRISMVVRSITGLILALLGLRVLLKLIAANPDNAFVHFIYNVSGVFAQPFQGIVGEPSSNGATLELNVLLAMVIYLLLAYGFLQLIRIFFNLTEPVEP